MATIGAIYPNFPPKQSEATANVWYMMLADYPAKDIEAQAIRHIRTSKYPPVISELIPQPKPVDVLSDWQRVTALISRYGYYRQEEALTQMTEAQKEAVRLIGYARICQSEPNALYKEFTAVYKPTSTEVMIV